MRDARRASSCFPSHKRPARVPRTARQPAVARDDVTALEGACRQQGFSSRTTTNARRRLAWASWPGPPHERSDTADDSPSHALDPPPGQWRPVRPNCATAGPIVDHRLTQGRRPGKRRSYRRTLETAGTPYGVREPSGAGAPKPASPPHMPKSRRDLPPHPTMPTQRDDSERLLQVAPPPGRSREHVAVRPAARPWPQ